MSVPVGCVDAPIHAPGSYPPGASTAPSPAPPSLSMFHSAASHTAFPCVTDATLSALPSSNSWAVPVPSSPGTPNISIISPESFVIAI